MTYLKRVNNKFDEYIKDKKEKKYKRLLKVIEVSYIFIKPRAFFHLLLSPSEVKDTQMLYHFFFISPDVVPYLNNLST